MPLRTDPPAGVVVTGLAVASPLGCTTKEFWAALTRGEVGTGPVTRFDTSPYRSRNGGQVAGFESDPELADRPLSVQYAVAVTGAALRDAGLTAGAPAGVCLGSVMGTRPHLERHGGPAPDTGEIALVPARTFRLTGPVALVSSGCSAGNDAIGHAVDLVASGQVDCMVAGGAEELSEAVYSLFTSLRALAPDVVRPFDAGRDGILPSEGAAAMVLESAARARARGARVYGRVLSYACAADAYHLTAPHPGGRALVACLTDALDRAGLPASGVDYLNAHGTGTPANDSVEAAALAGVFGGSRPMVSSIKGALGHAQGAASALEAVACVLALQEGVVPGMPTVARVDPECDVVDLVVGDARPAPVDVAASVAFGFGGSASALVLGADR